MMLSLPDADDWLERLGLVVLWRDLDELDEILQPPVIMLRAQASPREQRWLTFHAIAHTRLHCGNQLYMLRRGDRLRLAKQERQADAWAAKLLLPDEELLERVSDGLDLDEIAECFDVPAVRAELAIELLGRARPAADGTEAYIDRGPRLTREDLEFYLLHKEEVDAEARRLGWTPGDRRWS